ncbi:MAG: hypothetical protein JXA66_03575 [Oligoflexia bacterium]|nr:hypothetical protein [Oligoflexia bacterium]
MNTGLYITALSVFVLLNINSVNAKTFKQVADFRSELGSLAKKYGRAINEPQKPEPENKKIELTEKAKILKKEYERNTLIGKKITLKNLIIMEIASDRLIFRDEAEGQQAIFHYTSEQKAKVKRQVTDNPGKKFSVTGKFLKLSDFAEFNFVRASIQH